MKIKQSREAAGMSQRALAKRMKVSPSAVAQWETDITRPTIENRVDLARILNIPFADLMPEASLVGEMAIRDPQILAIVQQLLRLPGPVREAVLMQTAATAEALERRSGTDKPNG